jgi:hypothetical protein
VIDCGPTTSVAFASVSSGTTIPPVGGALGAVLPADWADGEDVDAMVDGEPDVVAGAGADGVALKYSSDRADGSA